MTSPYAMTIDLNVLDHLGINLYSNVAAVLTEIVANAWDADAIQVTIDYDSSKQEITISDDGIGMTIDDMNEKFLKVGYRRRVKEKTTTDRGRHVMGRKGLGKLSLFSIADNVRVESFKDGQQHGLTMSVERIRQAINDHQSRYVPDAVPSDALTVAKGTRIVLSRLKKGRVPSTMVALRRRLARRFTVIGGTDFNVLIDGDPVTAMDRDDIRAVEYLWHIGTVDPKRTKAAANLKHETTLPIRLEGWDSSWVVSGWIGTAVKPKMLVDAEGNNLNSIVLMAHGRLIQENILDNINDGRLYTKYLTGQLEADFLDFDNDDDIATSDRQRIQESDPRAAAMAAYLKSVLAKIEPQWAKWRRDAGADEVAQEHPVIKEWFDSIDEGYREQAKALLAKVHSLPIDNADDKKMILRDSIMAFERLKLRGTVHELINAVDIGADKLIPLIAQRDTLEATLYRDIIKSRIEVIRVFNKLVDDDEKEKALQQHLFDHMWLLDPTWERADGSELIETRLMEEGVIVDDLTKKEALGRVDIKYRTVLGTHIIVELKRAHRQMKTIELQEQGFLYVDKLTKILAAKGELNPKIEVVFVIGPPLPDQITNPQRVANMLEAVSPGSRIVHFDKLIDSALRAYQAYIDSNKKLDRIDKVVEQLA
ncbi:MULTISPECIES: ATP-binding protein [unclassified Pseudomonas]|uniref:BbrUII/HgiDII family restriction enzyme n=1 Tax=unclassified Pseudomonas TaxID=196821 RepID=UPI0024479A4D|nr:MULTISPECIES: ATP-binding protein [unclassified Pseudomonas]MDG9924478.1 ATP-binding protein [Pseudomonas sp. GD04045]MDH0035182.1 ATP-binding protein [Pseudomonas sp. GD04019]